MTTSEHVLAWIDVLRWPVVFLAAVLILRPKR